ncbi:MAG: hypothetical protein S0880_21245 [Actinomycetota bacterium]|nr:hypothetical protein [Actinomycetota bacterium]
MYTEVESLALTGPAVVILGYHLGILELVVVAVALMAVGVALLRVASRRRRIAHIREAERALTAELARRRDTVGADDGH